MHPSPPTIALVVLLGLSSYAGGALAQSAPSDAPSPATPPPRVVVERPPSILGWSLTGAGAVLGAAGAYFGVTAIDQWSTVTSKCNPDACRDRSAADDGAMARSSALTANVAITASILLIAAGVFLLVQKR